MVMVVGGAIRPELKGITPDDFWESFAVAYERFHELGALKDFDLQNLEEDMGALTKRKNEVYGRYRNALLEIPVEIFSQAGIQGEIESSEP